MKLMVVESPNKVKKIESILGDGWKVVASVGRQGARCVVICRDPSGQNVVATRGRAMREHDAIRAGGTTD